MVVPVSSAKFNKVSARFKMSAEVEKIFPRGLKRCQPGFRMCLQG